jgi:hypothetical protein
MIRTAIQLAFEVRFEPGDKIPVVLGEKVVGMVESIEPIFVLDGVIHYAITFLLEDEALRIAQAHYVFDGTPPLKVFFPRPLDQTNIQ